MTRPLALVTGAARGLGRALTVGLAESGYDVVINYLSSREDAEALAGEVSARFPARAWPFRADVGRLAEVAALFGFIAEQGAPLELVVNNVGIFDPVPLEQLTPERWTETIQTNLNGAFYVTHHALTAMPAGGHIVNVGVSGNQLNQAETFATDYYVSKAGLLQLTRSVAKVHARRKLRCNMVSPGQLVNSVGEVGGALAEVPLGRDGELADVLGAVLFLCDSSYITGANIEVAGGYRL